METLLDDAHTNYAKLLKIKEQIRNEYEEEKLLDESLLIRLEYLLNDNKTPTITWGFHAGVIHFKTIKQWHNFSSNLLFLVKM